ncbi:MAG: hypothetical protein PUH34_05650 [Eubacteriales bacterium]|nr:hypothetical protein [Eubacteriales bacterium]
MEKERTGEKLRRFIHPLVLKAISATRNFRQLHLPCCGCCYPDRVDSRFPWQSIAL